MLNTQRIRWTYEHFGFFAACKSIGYDLIAILAFAGYLMTLPFQFILILWRGCRRDKL